MIANQVRTLILAVAGLLLSSCGANNAVLRTNVSVDLKSSGIAILALGYAGNTPPYQNYWFQISGTSNAVASTRFFASPHNIFSDKKLADTSDKGTSELVALELPPGEYRVEQVGAFSDTGPYSGGGLKRPPLGPATFSVVAGEISYLGSALLQRQADGKFGYFINDESERDLGRLHRVRPDFRTLPAKKTLLSTASAL